MAEILRLMNAYVWELDVEVEFRAKKDAFLRHVV